MDRRAKFRKGLSSLYLPYYDGLCDILGPEWGPYRGFATFVEQAALFLKGRETPGPRVTRARAGESPHNYGCATDWCLWEQGQPYWPDAKSNLWLPYTQAIEKVGLKWGGSFESFMDCPHNELLIACDWKHILVIYNQSGMTGAQQHIEANLK